MAHNNARLIKISKLGLCGLLLTLPVACATMEPSDLLTTNSLPPEEQTLTGAAKTQFRDGNYGLAEDKFLEALEKDETNLEAWIGLAASYDQLGRFDLADKAYIKALKIGGRTPEILNNQGYSYLMRGDETKAFEILTEAARLDPDNPHIKGNLELVQKPRS
jgi:Flp pilus assembly protein TadD